MHVVLGGSKRETATFRVADHMAYYRAVKRRFEEAVAGEHPWPATTYPEPVDHCDVCRWDEVCRKRRRADDHLSLVAGIAARTRQELVERAGDHDPARSRGHVPAGRTRSRTPRRTRCTGSANRRASRSRARTDASRSTSCSTRRTCASGPTTARSSTAARAGQGPARAAGAQPWRPVPRPRRRPVRARRRRRLPVRGPRARAGRTRPASRRSTPSGHGTRRGAVTHAAETARVRAGDRPDHGSPGRGPEPPRVPLRALRADRAQAPHGPVRDARGGGRSAAPGSGARGPVPGRAAGHPGVASRATRSSASSRSTGSSARSTCGTPASSIVDVRGHGWSWAARPATRSEILELIERYNRDDVLSTWKLRDWLEGLRPELARMIGTRRAATRDSGCRRRVPSSPSGSSRSRRSRSRSRPGCRTSPMASAEPTTPDGSSHSSSPGIGAKRRPPGGATSTCCCELTDEERVAEPEPIGMLEFVRAEDDSGRLFRYRFPEQEHDIEAGGDVVDPQTQEGRHGHARSMTAPARSCCAMSKGREGMPPTVADPEPGGPTPTSRSRACCASGAGWSSNGIEADGRRTGPRATCCCGSTRGSARRAGQPLRRAGEKTTDEARAALALSLDRTHAAPSRGRPGSGKTYTGRADDRRPRAARASAWASPPTATRSSATCSTRSWRRRAEHPWFRVASQVGQKPGQTRRRRARDAKRATGPTTLARGALATRVRSTSSAARRGCGRERTSQRPSMCCSSTRRASSRSPTRSPSRRPRRALVLLGDPQQLDQPIQGSHPPGAERSALAHLLGQRPTMPPGAAACSSNGRGGCIRTSRLHVRDVLRGRARARAGQRAAGPGRGSAASTARACAGCRSTHAGARHRVDEEATAVAIHDRRAAALRRHLDRPAGSRRTIRSWRTSWSSRRTTPTRADQRRCATAGLTGVRVGTVDKFQGQEAPISIYSMATLERRGGAARHGVPLLAQPPQRRDVTGAVPRRRRRVPELVRVRCQTPRQMQLANALCRLVEVAAP